MALGSRKCAVGLRNAKVVKTERRKRNQNKKNVELAALIRAALATIRSPRPPLRPFTFSPLLFRHSPRNLSLFVSNVAGRQFYIQLPDLATPRLLLLFCLRLFWLEEVTPLTSPPLFPWSTKPPSLLARQFSLPTNGPLRGIAQTPTRMSRKRTRRRFGEGVVRRDST